MLQNNQKIFVKIIVFLFLGVFTLKAQKTVIDDPLQGSTKGKKVGGSLTSEGFKPGVGKYHKSGNSEDHILYEVTKANGGKVIENGYVEFQVKGFRMSDFESTSSSLPSRENGFMVLYDGRGVNEPLKYDPDSKHNYFYWVIHYRSEKYKSSAGNKWKTIINCAEPISLRINSSKAVFTDATGDNGLVDAKDGKTNLLDRDWTVEPNGIRTSWDPNKWYTIRVQWNNEKREFKVFRDGQLVWFNELEEGSSWRSYDNSTNPAPYSWRPLDLKIWLGSGTGRYDNDMKNMYYRNFKVVDQGGSSTDDPTPPPTTPSITVTSPNGGEKLQVGKTHSIKWNEKNIARVKIEYSTNSGSNWNLIASEATNSGSYSWLVPNTPSENCIVRLTGTVSGKSDVSNSKFTIQTETAPPPPPSSEDLVVLSPNGGESWTVGSVQNVTWSAPSDINFVNIFFSSNFNSNNPTAASWTRIKYSANTGSYSWTVPNNVSSQCMIRIKDAQNQSNVDLGNAVFSIVKSGGTPPPPPPPPSSNEMAVVSPNGGESWSVGSKQTITWSTPAGVNNVNIFFSSNFNPQNPTAAKWTKVDYVSNSGSYSWNVPSTISSNCVIRIKDGVNNSNVDISDAVFTITKEGTTPPPPSGNEMMVVSPNGGESWGVGSKQTITWTSPSNVQKVNIFFSSNYDPNNPTAASWKKIAYTNNDGNFSWSVPNNISSKCVIRIKDAFNTSNVDIGDANFSIVSGSSITKKDGESELSRIEEIPDEYSLEQNYPNPFNPTTEIKFGLKKSQNVKITVYNMMGEEVRQLVNNQLNAGIHYISFDATGLASGVYIYRLISDDFTSTKRMTLLK